MLSNENLLQLRSATLEVGAMSESHFQERDLADFESVEAVYVLLSFNCLDRYHMILKVNCKCTKVRESAKINTTEE